MLSLGPVLVESVMLLLGLLLLVERVRLGSLRLPIELLYLLLRLLVA